MSQLIGFMIHHQEPLATGVGSKSEHLMAMDLFVMINLAFLLFMLGFFACWAWLIWRRTTKPEPHIQLIMEMQDLARHPISKSSSQGAENESEGAPWTRNPDWWKQ